MHDIQNTHIFKTPQYFLVPSRPSAGQTILDGYISRNDVSEIKLNEIIAICKGSCPGFYSFDIANEVANNLSKRGIKVWR